MTPTTQRSPSTRATSLCGGAARVIRSGRHHRTGRKVVFRQHGELARHLLRGLVKRGFDVANIARFDPRGNPARGVSHMVSNLVPEVDPGLKIPLVCVFLNEYYPPLPSAARCAHLGEAIADALRDRPER